MTTSTYDRCAVSHLLDLLVKDQPNVHWYQRGSYTNGQGEALVEIIIYEGTYRKIRGIIVYNAYTGRVISLRYQRYTATVDTEAEVVDTLLDLINFEKKEHWLYA
uniref:Uncharacterized protein n=1 Tax=Roseihalotalea indica TaxID=2867963 RepID=A0AA49GU79_9BACT|nr:hypothetical protein K4G66_12795 [Tunicatimonas sp. TK19036]